MIARVPRHLGKKVEILPKEEKEKQLEAYPSNSIRWVLSHLSRSGCFCPYVVAEISEISLHGYLHLECRNDGERERNLFLVLTRLLGTEIGEPRERTH